MVNLDEIKDEELKKLITNIEKDLLSQMILSLQDKKITIKGTRTIAKDFLSTFPIENKKNLFDKLEELSKKYPEVRNIYIKYADKYFEEEKQKALKAASEHIDQGDIEKALSAVKGTN